MYISNPKADKYSYKCDWCGKFMTFEEWLNNNNGAPDAYWVEWCNKCNKMYYFDIIRSAYDRVK